MGHYICYLLLSQYTIIYIVTFITSRVYSYVHIKPCMRIYTLKFEVNNVISLKYTRQRTIEDINVKCMTLHFVIDISSIHILDISRECCNFKKLNVNIFSKGRASFVSIVRFFLKHPSNFASFLLRYFITHNKSYLLCVCV